MVRNPDRQLRRHPRRRSVDQLADLKPGAIVALDQPDKRPILDVVEAWVEGAREEQLSPTGISSYAKDCGSISLALADGERACRRRFTQTLVAECGKGDAAADGFHIVVLNLFRPVRMRSA
jgi:hypothetical protein